VRTTPTMLRVLKALEEHPSDEHYGYEILKTTGIQGGSLYPILDRLEREQWVTASWKVSPLPGRPPRRYYRLTGLGVRMAKIARNEALRSSMGSLRPLAGSQ